MTGALSSLLNRRFWVVAALYTIGAALFIGLPTRLIPNGFFVRMIPTSPRDYVIWAVTAVLFGPTLALSTLYPAASLGETWRQISSGDIRAVAGAMLSFFSVGCPVCNKLVVLALGVSGALTIFDPLRPFLGIAAIFTLGLTLYLRLRSLRYGCALPAKATSGAPGD